MAPRWISKSWVATSVAPERHPLTGYGAPRVVLFAVGGGARAELEAEGAHGTRFGQRGRDLVLEGGDRLWVFRRRAD